MRFSFILRTISLRRRPAAVSPDLSVSGGSDKFYVMLCVSLHHRLAIFKVVLWCFRRWWCVESSHQDHYQTPFPAVVFYLDPDLVHVLGGYEVGGGGLDVLSLVLFHLKVVVVAMVMVVLGYSLWRV
jgi:hypothetical protein